MKIAVQGCVHGELGRVYGALAPDVELLVICGDVQTLRSTADLRYLNVPPKYRSLGDFHSYYREGVPLLTIFIGGNHEDSRYLDQFPQGGFVAPNLYYLGRAGVVWYGGLRIAGWSGIYKAHDFEGGHPQYNFSQDWAVRKAYHVRSEEYLKLSMLERDQQLCFVTHDWPEGVYRYGDVGGLLKKKPFFKRDIEKGQLGNPWAMRILEAVRPGWWWSAHLHVRFEASIIEGSQDPLMLASKRGASESRAWWPKAKRLRGAEQPAGAQHTDVSGQGATPNDAEIELDLDEADRELGHLDATDSIVNDNEIELDLELDADDKDVKTTPMPAPSHTQPAAECATGAITRFLALDKPVRPRASLATLEIPVVDAHDQHGILHHDPEFIAILQAYETHRAALSALTVEELANLPAGLMEKFRADIVKCRAKINTPIPVESFVPSQTDGEVETNPQTLSFQARFLSEDQSLK